MVFSRLLERAIELAAEWHDRTYRKSRWRDPAFEVPPDSSLKIPVMAHLTAVALTLQRADWNEQVVAAGFLHDILEDPNYHGDFFTYEQLVTQIGKPVADLVLGVTETKFDARGNWRLWQVRKEDYLTNLRNSPTEVIAISLADKIHNLWTMNRTLEAGVDIYRDGPGRKAFNAGPEQQRWYFREVLAIAASHQDDRLEPLRNRLTDETGRFVKLTGIAS